jgi:hypothetical protein
MVDFFLDNLDMVTLEDVRNFLALNESEDLRPTEGQRIDFKRWMPDRFGEKVAAMANAYGGLIFVGVDSDKTKQNLPTSISGVDLGADAKTRITNIVLSTVSPWPTFQVRVLSDPTTNRCVALVRVSEGNWPPYAWSQTKIPIRIIDKNQPATLEQIEALFKKRDLYSRPLQTEIRPHLESMGIPGADDFQRAVLMPRYPMHLRLDSTFEKEFGNMVYDAFRELLSGVSTFSFIENRTATVYQTGILPADSRYPIWQCSVWSNGSIGFVSPVAREGPTEAPVGYAVGVLAMFLTTARVFYEKLRIFGSLAFAHELILHSLNFLPQFPSPGGYRRYDSVGGISFPERFVSTPSADVRIGTFEREFDVQQLNQPAPLIADTMLYQLRDTSGAKIDYDKLLTAVMNLPR